jgi:tRNA A37 methylthiotransferase MiaB
MKNQVPEAVKHQRVAILSHISEESCAAILDRALATPDAAFTILPETRGRGFVMGHTPDFLEVKVLTDCPLRGEELTVRPLRREGEILVCEPFEPVKP